MRCLLITVITHARASFPPMLDLAGIHEEAHYGNKITTSLIGVIIYFKNIDLRKKTTQILHHQNDSASLNDFALLKSTIVPC